MTAMKAKAKSTRKRKKPLRDLKPVKDPKAGDNDRKGGRYLGMPP